MLNRIAGMEPPKLADFPTVHKKTRAESGSK